METPDPRLDEISGFYAALMVANSGSSDARLGQVFKRVPRQAFFPPGPWQIHCGDHYLTTPSADPIYLYQNALVALDAERGINNGEPFLHARWMGAVAPQPGETVLHIGAGSGYYSALLSRLVLPGGTVTAFEIQPTLAAAATANLHPYGNVAVKAGDAVTQPVPSADVIYVNAGVVAPPLAWLQALQLGGRMIFPWRPAANVGLAVIIQRIEGGLSVQPLMPSWFIPCVGASEAPHGSRAPSMSQAWNTRSVHMTRDAAPDETATAVYGDIWFSSRPIAAPTA